MAVTIGRETVESDSRKWIDVPIAADLGRYEHKLSLCVVNGATDGPTVWLQGGIHGNEQLTALTIRDFVNDLQSDQLKGTVIGVPAANLSGFSAKHRDTVVSGRGRNDANRAFPGRSVGTYTEKLAHTITGLATEHADYFIDCHSTGEQTLMRPGFTMVKMAGDEAVDDRAFELAEATGFPYTVASEADAEGAGASTEYMANEGIPSLVYQIGGSGRVHDWSYDGFTSAFRNTLRHLDMSGEPLGEREEHSIHYGWKYYRAQQGGFVEITCDFDERVDEGDQVAEITNFEGEVLEELTASEPGIVLHRRTYPVAQPGDVCVSTIPPEGVKGKSHIR